MMSRQFELIVFDWDGTLMDSAARIVASLQAAGDELGLRNLDETSLRNVIGLGMREAIQVLHPDLDGEQTSQFTARYRQHFMVSCPLPEKLFDGVPEILNTLTQKKLYLGVATGKSRRGLNRSLDETGCKRFFHSTRCADETCSKPDPQMLIEIIEELDVEPASTLMIGDTEYDLEMAQRAGVASLGVTYGAHELHRLEQFQPLACLDSISNLALWLDENLQTL